jgi:DNA-binding transcriptional LysR family regulator
MDLVQGFRIFVAAVETGSFSGAALRLGISAKLASKYIAALEQRLGRSFCTAPHSGWA